MSDEQQETAADEGVPADLLSLATKKPSGVEVEDFNPMEKIPTLTVGGDFEPGMTISGWYQETECLASIKFTHSKTKNAEGIPTSFRHVLRIGSASGAKLAIWSCAELKLAFEKTQPGTFISITYKSRGLNGKGQKQHFFDLKREAPKTH